MNKQDTEYYKKLLLELRNELMYQLEGPGATLSSNFKESSGEHSSYSFHLADMGTDTMEREKAFWVASMDTKLLHEIDYALEKINNDEFGLCEQCSNPINNKRLEAIPHARLCIECKSTDEMSTS